MHDEFIPRGLSSSRQRNAGSAPPLDSYIYIYTFICIYICTYICMYYTISIYVSTYILEINTWRVVVLEAKNRGFFPAAPFMYIYIYTLIYMYVHIYIHIYILYNLYICITILESHTWSVVVIQAKKRGFCPAARFVTRQR